MTSEVQAEINARARDSDKSPGRPEGVEYDVCSGGSGKSVYPAPLITAPLVTAPVTGKKAPPFVPLRDANSAQRKMMPVISGVLDYFPDALSAVAFISYLGNEKHNPGEPLHWARGKSDDHIDCTGRHLLHRDMLDQEGIMEGAQMVWRALAWLQLAIEKQYKLPPAPGSTV